MLFRKKSQAAAPVAAPAPAMVPADGETDIRGLGRVLWQKKTRIVMVTALAAGAAFVVVNAITPQFRSESRLLLEARENVFLRAEADKNVTERATIDPEAVASQIQVVLSRDLAHDVIQKEKLADNPEFEGGASSPVNALLRLIGLGRDLSTMTREERTLEAFYEHLNVQQVPTSRVISIDFSSANPQLAANVANAIAEAYLRMQQNAKLDQTRAAGSWLAGEIEKMRKKVSDAEDKVERYRANKNLFVGSNNTSLPSQQLTEINSQIAAARGQQADLQARAQQLRDLIRSGKTIDSSDIANSDTMRRLIEQRIALRSQLAEQSTTLGPRHPRIQELKAQIADIDRQIRVEGERLARQLDNDAKVAGNRLQTLSASFDTVKKLASQSNEQDVELRALEREAKTDRSLLESYLAKYREASARDSINAAPPEARIISRATPAIKPAYPKKLPTVLIAAFAAFALQAGFAVTGALLAAPGASSYGYAYAPASYAAAGYEPAMMAPAPMPRMNSPPLAPMPPGGLGGGFAAAPMTSPMNPPTNAPLPVVSIEQVAQGLRQAGDAGRSVTVVGTGRNVGTTFAAITLARALAKDGSVVLVDMAFDAPNLSVISTDPNAPGIAELVRGTASFGDIITRDQYSRVHLVATGNVGNDAAALAASPMLATVIEALMRSYDHVVIDAGSAAEVAVGRIAPLAQQAMLVTGDPADPSTRAARERLLLAGVADVAVLPGGAHAAAA
jgi:succinoglycan biosynthesis transport protein ExoP